MPRSYGCRVRTETVRPSCEVLACVYVTRLCYDDLVERCFDPVSTLGAYTEQFDDDSN